jgi:hypothetical protein
MNEWSNEWLVRCNVVQQFCTEPPTDMGVQAYRMFGQINNLFQRTISLLWQISNLSEQIIDYGTLNIMLRRLQNTRQHKCRVAIPK